MANDPSQSNDRRNTPKLDESPAANDLQSELLQNHAAERFKNLDLTQLTLTAGTNTPETAELERFEIAQSRSGTRGQARNETRETDSPSDGSRQKKDPPKWLQKFEDKLENTVGKGLEKAVGAIENSADRLQEQIEPGRNPQRQSNPVNTAQAPTASQPQDLKSQFNALDPASKKAMQQELKAIHSNAPEGLGYYLRSNPSAATSFKLASNELALPDAEIGKLALGRMAIDGGWGGQMEAIAAVTDVSSAASEQQEQQGGVKLKGAGQLLRFAAGFTPIGPVLDRAEQIRDGVKVAQRVSNGEKVGLDDLGSIAGAFGAGDLAKNLDQVESMVKTVKHLQQGETGLLDLGNKQHIIANLQFEPKRLENIDKGSFEKGENKQRVVEINKQRESEPVGPVNAKSYDGGWRRDYTGSEANAIANELEAAVRAKGGNWDPAGLNVVSVRGLHFNKGLNNDTKNAFDDTFFFVRGDGKGNYDVAEAAGTTSSGVSRDGVADLITGEQYEFYWSTNENGGPGHKGQNPAGRTRAQPIQVYRDGQPSEATGINFHWASDNTNPDTSKVNNFSLGCQVLACGRGEFNNLVSKFTHPTEGRPKTENFRYTILSGSEVQALGENLSGGSVVLNGITRKA